MSYSLFQLLCQRRGLDYPPQKARLLEQFVIYMERHSYWLSDIREEQHQRIFRFSDETSHLELSEAQILHFLRRLKAGEPLPWEALMLGTKRGVQDGDT